MHNTLRLVTRVRVASSILPVPRLYTLPPTLFQPFQTPCPPQIPTLVPCLQQQVERFSCGSCPPSKSTKDKKGKSAEKGNQNKESKKGGKQCSGVKGKRGESKGKGGQCSEVKGKRGKSQEKGGQCKAVKGKGKSNDRGSQCSSTKGKGGGSKGKGGQCSDVKGKRDKNHESQCSEMKGKTDDAKDVAKAKTVICEGDDGKDHGDESSKKEEKFSSSSSSSSSDNECSEEEGKKDESSEDETPPKKECPDEPIDPEQEEKNAKAVTEMCACIQSALAQSKPGPKGGDARVSQQRDTSGRPRSCGTLPKEDSKPKISEHVKCCQIETSKTAPLKSNASSCQAKNESSGKDKDGISKDDECTDDKGEGGGKGDLKTKDDPCECIKKALNQCKKGAPNKKEKSSKKSSKKDEKSAKKENKSEKRSSDKPDKEEGTSEEEEPSQCGPQGSQCGEQESDVETKSFGKKDCRSKEFTVKCR